MNIALRRLVDLLDRDSFTRMDDQCPSIHLLGRGLIDGRKVYCCAGISDSGPADIHECFRRKMLWLDAIIKDPAPVVWLHDAPPQAPGGRTPIPARSDELLASDHGVGRSFCLQARLRSVTPQISVMFTDLGAAQCFPLRLADFALMKRGSHVWIGRPDAVRLMTGSKPDPDRLGGAEMHCRVSGVGDLLFSEDGEAFAWIRNCLACLPSKVGDRLPSQEPAMPEKQCSGLTDFIPADPNKSFDMRGVMRCIIDAGSWVGIKDLYAPEVLTGLARVSGMPVGILANNSAGRGGILFPEACRKMTSFIRFCDRYGLPMLFLVDNPGLMVGEAVERSGMLAEASELLIALAESSAPRACLVIRKAYTVGLYAMSGPGFEPTRFWATPNSSISVFGPKALDFFAADRDIPAPAAAAIEEMRHHALNPGDYLERGYLSGIIQWPDLRTRIEEFVRESI